MSTFIRLSLIKYSLTSVFFLPYKVSMNTFFLFLWGQSPCTLNANEKAKAGLIMTYDKSHVVSTECCWTLLVCIYFSAVSGSKPV